MTGHKFIKSAHVTCYLLMVRENKKGRFQRSELCFTQIRVKIVSNQYFIIVHTNNMGV